MKPLLFINQAPGTLHRDIVKYLHGHGVAVRQLIGGNPDELDMPPVPTHRSCARDIRTPLRRLATWLRFGHRSLWTMIRRRKHHGLLVTNPPFVPWVAPVAKKLFGFKYTVLMYDLYPDIMHSLGMIQKNSRLYRLLWRVNAWSLRNAESVITLGRCMAATTEQYLRPTDNVPVHVIHNWMDVDAIKPIAKEENPFVKEHGLADKLVVMYSGNWSPTHGIDLIVQLADEIQEHREVQFVLIGEGVCKAEIEADIKARNLSNVTVLPWQPYSQFPYSIAAGDIQIVSLDEQFFGISMPSKTYSCLAAGCALLAITPAGSELQAIAKEHDCGQRVAPRDFESLRTALMNYVDDPQLLQRHRTHSRQAAEEHFNANVCCQQYLDVLSKHLK